jgi:hypothetical protein
MSEPATGVPIGVEATLSRHDQGQRPRRQRSKGAPGLCPGAVTRGIVHTSRRVQRRPGRHAPRSLGLLDAPLVVPAPTERSPRDPAGDPARHRSGPVQGLITQAHGSIDAPRARLEHPVPELRGCGHPGLRFQRLPTGVDPVTEPAPYTSWTQDLIEPGSPTIAWLTPGGPRARPPTTDTGRRRHARRRDLLRRHPHEPHRLPRRHRRRRPPRPASTASRASAPRRWPSTRRPSPAGSPRGRAGWSSARCEHRRRASPLGGRAHPRRRRRSRPPGTGPAAGRAGPGARSRLRRLSPRRCPRSTARARGR